MRVSDDELLPEHFLRTYIELYKCIAYKVTYRMTYCRAIKYLHALNSFLTNVPILHPLKTPKSESFSGVFEGGTLTAQRMKFSTKEFFGKCDQIWSHLMKKILNGNVSSHWPEMV